MSTSRTRRSPLTSPSHVIGLRARAERRNDRDLGGMYDAFVADLLTMAADAHHDGALVAAADPFVYTNVMNRWRAGIRTLAEARADLTALQVLSTLERANLPLRLYEAARDVLLAARVEGWSTWWTKVQLGKVLIPRYEDGMRRSLYRAQITRAARTAATWSTAHEVQLKGMEEGYTRQRWVARMDPRTRHTHMKADGQTVPLGQPFQVGDHYLDAPGDPSAPHEETANCRCVVVLVSD